MEKVLVTGGAGFIGSHLVDRLVSEGRSVRIIDNFSSGRIENLMHIQGDGGAEVIRGDLKDPEDALKAVEGADVVFHYAANPEVRLSTTNPEIHFSENILATFNLLEAMRRKGIRKLVFASSSSVYGEPEAIPVGEDAPIKPVSVYGASKASCESLIHAYASLYGLKAVILRYANVVGPRLRHGIVYDLTRKLLQDGRRLEVLGDGSQIRSYVYIADALEATMIAFRNLRSSFEVYNVGNEDWATVDEVAKTIIDALRMGDLSITHRPILHGIGWRGDVKRIALRLEKLGSLGFKPMMKSLEAVERTAEAIACELGSLH